MNREQRRHPLQPGKGPTPRLEERPLTTNYGIDLERGKVVVEYSMNLRHIFMPPDEAINCARFLIQAARRLNPDLPALTAQDQEPASG